MLFYKLLRGQAKRCYNIWCNSSDGGLEKVVQTFEMFINMKLNILYRKNRVLSKVSDATGFSIKFYIEPTFIIINLTAQAKYY